MSALKRFFNIIFGTKPEVKKKRRLSKTSEKPKAVYDLFIEYNQLKDLTMGTNVNFTGTWAYDKEVWRKFYAKNNAIK